MTLDEWVDDLWKQTAGWLGWTPEVFDHTPFPIIEMALDGALDVECAINPNVQRVTGAVDVRGAPKKVNREKVSKDLMRMFDQMMRKPAQQKVFG